MTIFHFFLIKLLQVKNGFTLFQWKIEFSFIFDKKKPSLYVEETLSLRRSNPLSLSMKNALVAKKDFRKCGKVWQNSFTCRNKLNDNFILNEMLTKRIIAGISVLLLGSLMFVFLYQMLKTSAKRFFRSAVVHFLSILGI